MAWTAREDRGLVHGLAGNSGRHEVSGHGSKECPVKPADWHVHCYGPERRFDLIRQAAKRDLARRVPRDGTDQAPSPARS